MIKACEEHGVKVVEFTVAPQITPDEGLPYHEWLVEFDEDPNDMKNFAQSIDNEMTVQNIYYKDLIKGNILQPLKITKLAKDSFRNYMKSKGKLGGQNKVPRLANDRTIAKALDEYKLG